MRESGALLCQKGNTHGSCIETLMLETRAHFVASSGHLNALLAPPLGSGATIKRSPLTLVEGPTTPRKVSIASTASAPASCSFKFCV